MARDVVIGLGNRFVHDDAIGLRVAEELRARGLPERGVEVKDYEEMDLSLLEEVKDASLLILVDSVKSGSKPGTVSLFEVVDKPGGEDSLPSLHELDLSELIGLARRMGLISCPVVVVGIEPADLTLGEGLSDAVRSALPVAAEAVVSQLSTDARPAAPSAASALPAHDSGKEAASEISSGPRLTVILVNQSASMGAELQDYGISTAEGVADVLNLLLQKVAQRREAEKQKGPSQFESANFGIAVVGYGSEPGAVDRVLYIDAERTEADPRLTRPQTSTISSDASLSTFPFWIIPVTGAPGAPLPAALAAATAILESWIPSHRLAPPPQVINITDGALSVGDPSLEADRLKSCSTLNGRAVLWTCQLAHSSGAKPLLFPTASALGAQLEPGRETLFRCSSEFPRESIPDLMMEFPEVSKVSGARACVLDSDLRTLVRFVSFVTRVPLP